MGEGHLPTEEQLDEDRPAPKSLTRELWDTKCWRIFPLLTIYVISLTLLMPIKPSLMTDFFASRSSDHYIRCEDYASNMEPKVCRDAHSSAVTFSSWSDFVSNSFLLFLLAPMVGKWSDAYGRKPFLMLTFLCASCTVFVLFLNLNFGVSMYFYFPAQAVNGALSSVSICMAYIADKMHQENRAPTFGLIICSFSVGILVGPLGGGYIPPSTASIAALCGILFCVLYVLLFIPESVSMEKKLEARERQKNAPLHLRGPFQGFAILMRSPLFIKLTICVMIAGIVAEGMYELIMQYFQIKLGFGIKDQSHMYVLSGVCGMLTQLILLRILLKYAGKSGMLLIGLAASVVQQTLMIFVWSKSSALVAICIGTVGNLSFPAISSIKSLNVDENEQGAMQGALSGARALAQGLGPLIFAGLFALFTQSWSPFPFFPGAPFIFGAVMLFIAFCLAATINRKHANEGISRTGSQESLNQALLSDEEKDDVEEFKEALHLPENYVVQHDGPGMLMNMTPDIACDVLPPFHKDVLHRPAERSKHQSDNNSVSDCSSTHDLESGLPESYEARVNIDPKDSAVSRHGQEWREYFKWKQAREKEEGPSNSQD